jgi:hypothetical protein
MERKQLEREARRREVVQEGGKREEEEEACQGEGGGVRYRSCLKLVSLPEKG